MSSGKILFICGSKNQTLMMHNISKHLSDFECWFSPYYADGLIRFFSRTSVLDFSILGGKLRRKTLEYLRNNNLLLDYEGLKHRYDLVFTCSDLIIPKNTRRTNIILVQEGMTDAENFMFTLVKYLKLPRWFASTSATGISDLYNKFCVASEGYKQLFINKEVREDKIEVTGIPNFDNCNEFLNNNFPHKGYVLVATSDARETFKYENRKEFIKKAVKIAAGRQLIFKLHPNENTARAASEINQFAPGAIIYSSGNTEEMVANCDVLITKYSSVVYPGLALGKEVYSEYDLEELKKLLPIQNEGRSASNIAQVARQLLKFSERQIDSKDAFKKRRNLLKKRTTGRIKRN